MTELFASSGSGANVTVEMRPKQVKDWLDTLSSDDPAERARAIDTALAALNRLKISADARIKLLDLYRDAAHRLRTALEERFVAARLPLPEQGQIAVELARQLQVDLAIGYKLALQEQQRHSHFGHNRLLSISIQRALSCLCQALQVCYQGYSPAPSGIWQEIHELYRAAMDASIEDETVADGSAQSSPSLAYRQVLLLALVDPYSLMQGEAGRTMDYLARFADRAQLQELMHPSDLSALFLVRTSDDGPPKAMGKNVVVVDSRTDLLLNATALVGLLEEQLARLEAGDAPQSLLLPGEASEPSYQDLLRRLSKAWHIVSRRQFKRIHNSAAVDLCAGIRAIPCCIAEPHSDTPPDTGVSHWLMINESPGGLALRSVSDAQPAIHPGEIVALKTGEDGHWHIAVVRWAKSPRPGQLELGTQLLAPQASVAAIKPAVTATAASFQTVLHLPEIPLLKQPATLAAPRGSFQPQREFLLNEHGEIRIIRATRLMEHTARFERFQFSFV